MSLLSFFRWFCCCCRSEERREYRIKRKRRNRRNLMQPGRNITTTPTTTPNIRIHTVETTPSQIGRSPYEKRQRKDKKKRRKLPPKGKKRGTNKDKQPARFAHGPPDEIAPAADEQQTQTSKDEQPTDVTQNLMEDAPKKDDLPENTADAPKKDDLPENTADAPKKDDLPENTADAPKKDDLPENTADAPKKDDLPENSADEATAQEMKSDRTAGAFNSSSVKASRIPVPVKKKPSE